jgi:ACDE family multidrug resistance protein
MAFPSFPARPGRRAAAPSPPGRPAASPRRAGVRDFALLFGLDSAVRGLLLSVVPLEMYRAWGEGSVVSALFLASGLASLMAGLLVPWAAARVGRGRMLVGAGAFYLLGLGLLAEGGRWAMALAVPINAVGTVTVWVCLSAYVLDHIPREALGRNESMRLLYGATSWTAGPFLGVLLLGWWRPAPFLLAAVFAGLLIAAFVRLGLGDGRRARAADGPALAYLGRFLRRPRLIAGWTFATVRSCGWWVFIVYLPLFCLQEGLDEAVAGAAVSLASVFLFATPWLLRVVQRFGVRGAVRATFGWTALFFALGWAVAGVAPWATVGSLVLAALGLVMLDVCASLPFLMAVKPSERTEMAAVYSSFRDVSGILSPLVGGLILLVAPAAATFAATGAAMAGAWALAGTVHPRLGQTGPRAGPGAGPAAGG